MKVILDTQNLPGNFQLQHTYKTLLKPMNTTLTDKICRCDIQDVVFFWNSFKSSIKVRPHYSSTTFLSRVNQVNSICIGTHIQHTLHVTT